MKRWSARRRCGCRIFDGGRCYFFGSTRNSRKEIEVQRGSTREQSTMGRQKSTDSENGRLRKGVEWGRLSRRGLGMQMAKEEMLKLQNGSTALFARQLWPPLLPLFSGDHSRQKPHNLGSITPAASLRILGRHLNPAATLNRAFNFRDSACVDCIFIFLTGSKFLILLKPVFRPGTFALKIEKAATVGSRSRRTCSSTLERFDWLPSRRVS